MQSTTVDVLAVQDAARPDLNIAFVLLEGFTMYPLAQLIDPIRFAAGSGFTGSQHLCQWQWMTWNNRPVTSSCGLMVNPTTAVNFEDDWDYVVFVGGLLEGVLTPPAAMLEGIRQLYARKIPLIALDSGAFVIAASGVLDGKRCAVHFSVREAFKARFPQVITVLDHNYLCDGGIISTPGGSSLDLAVDLIRHHCGEARAKKIEKYMMVETRKQLRPPQGRGRLKNDEPHFAEDLVQRTVGYMKNHMASPTPLQEITLLMNVTMRQLNKAFLHSTGDTAAVHWRKMRLNHARKLMVNSDSGIYEIALMCGFANATHLINLFRKHYGETPACYRRRCRNADRLYM